MTYKFEYTLKAWKDLQKLDKRVSRRIVKKMRYLMEQSNPMQFAKELKGDFKGLYRFRIGDYRIIFTKDTKGRIEILTIIRIKHRKDIYH